MPQLGYLVHISSQVPRLAIAPGLHTSARGEGKGGGGGGGFGGRSGGGGGGFGGRSGGGEGGEGTAAHSDGPNPLPSQAFSPVWAAVGHARKSTEIVSILSFIVLGTVRAASFRGGAPAPVCIVCRAHRV